MTPSYNWEKIYLSAVYETDTVKMAGRILDARSAMEQRLLSPICNEELAALQRAMEGLELLRAERDDPNSSPGTSPSGNKTA